MTFSKNTQQNFFILHIYSPWVQYNHKFVNITNIPVQNGIVSRYYHGPYPIMSHRKIQIVTHEYPKRSTQGSQDCSSGYNNNVKLYNITIIYTV